jgi:hypothetical protein
VDRNGSSSGNSKSGSVTTAAISFNGNIVLGKKKREHVYKTPQYKVDGNYYLSKNGILYVKYIGEYNESEINIQLFDDNQNQVFLSQGTLNTIYQHLGDNRFQFNFTCSGTPLEPGYYTLVLINAKNEKVYLRFKQNFNPSC